MAHDDEPFELEISHRSVQRKCDVCRIKVHGFRVVFKRSGEFSCLEGSISLSIDCFSVQIDMTIDLTLPAPSQSGQLRS